MLEKIEAAVEKLSELATACQDSQKALHYSQAVLNLSQARQLVVNSKK